MTASMINGLRVGMIALVAGGALLLTACEKEGQVGQTVKFNVAEASAEDIETALKEDGKVSLTGGVVFELNSAELSETGSARTADLAEVLKNNPGFRVAVVGHTDDTGPFQNNINLSTKRAQSMMNALVKDHGIDKTRLAAVGVGPLSPIASNATEEGRAQNRRVEVVIIQ